MKPMNTYHMALGRRNFARNMGCGGELCFGHEPAPRATYPL